MRNINLRNRAQRGFTMIELIFVVVIVGILSTLAAGAYGQFKSKAAASEALAMVPAAMLAYESAYSARNTVPSNNNAAGLELSTNYHGQYVSAIDADVNGLSVIFKAGLETGLAGANIKFVPYANTSGGIVWGCAGGAIPTASDGITALTLATGASTPVDSTVAVAFRPAICNS